MTSNEPLGLDQSSVIPEQKEMQRGVQLGGTLCQTGCLLNRHSARGLCTVEEG